MTTEHEPIETFPSFPPRIIDALDEVYPNRPPSPSTTERADIYHAGQHSVVEFLRRVLADQQERTSDRLGG